LQACTSLDPDITYLQSSLAIWLLGFGLYHYRAILDRIEDDDDQRVPAISLQIVEDLNVGNRIEILLEYRRYPRLIKFSGICDGIELLVDWISSS